MELELAFDSGDPEQIREGLLITMYHERDWPWAQETCLRFISHKDARVRLAAVRCLGDLARTRHAPLDFDRVLPQIVRLTTDPEMGFAATDALEDIEFARSRER
jgi:hypothetical protein